MLRLALGTCAMGLIVAACGSSGGALPDTSPEGSTPGGPTDGAAGDASPDDATPPDPDATPADGGSDGGGDAAPPPIVWPNATSFASSDPWIMQHHDEITAMHPRALLIHFANGSTVADVTARFDLQKSAMQEATRYHGYGDPSAPPFLSYELAKLVDLTDATIPPNWTAPNSTKMPRRNGGIDFGALFGASFADAYGVPDPAQPSRNMTLCEILTKGFAQELFIVFNKSGSDANVPEILEYKQIYDGTDAKVAGQFDDCAGNGCVDPADLAAVAACGHSVRIGFLEMNGVIGNSLHVNFHNYEHIGLKAVPHFYEMYEPFENFDLRGRFGVPFDSWYDVCDYTSNDCVAFTGTDALDWKCDPGTSCAGQTGTMSPYAQGCGSAHFPANARYHYDYYNTSPVLSTCEHFGLQDGPNGADLATPYDSSKIAGWEAKYGSGVGGGWHIYAFQNFPGYKNHAKLPDGAPMKNWWPYLYY